MFSVWGAVFADKFFFQRLAYVYLAPKASCGGEQGLSGMEETIIEVAKLLRVLKNGVQNLESHYKDLPQPPPSLQVPSSIGPIRPTAGASPPAPAPGASSLTTAPVASASSSTLTAEF